MSTHTHTDALTHAPQACTSGLLVCVAGGGRDHQHKPQTPFMIP